LDLTWKVEYKCSDLCGAKCWTTTLSEYVQSKNLEVAIDVAMRRIKELTDHLGTSVTLESIEQVVGT